MLEVDNNQEEAVDVSDAQFGNSESKTNYKPFDKSNFFSLKNGSNIFRIMPPMFSALEDGFWSVYYGKHFGYYDEQGRMKSYSCMKKYDKETRALVEECLFCQDQERKLASKKTLEARVTTLSGELDVAQSKGQPVKELLEQLEEARSELSVATKIYSPRQQRFWVNAMNLEGEFGLLGLPKMVYEALSGKREPDPKTGKYVRLPGLLTKVKEKEKIDTLDVNQGIFWNIERSGSTQYDTKYNVSPFKTERQLDDGTVVEVTKKAPLSADQKKLALTKCKDLNHVFDYLFLTKEQALAVINGSPSAVTAVENAPREVPKVEKVETETTSREPPSWLSDKELLEKFKSKSK